MQKKHNGKCFMSFKIYFNSRSKILTTENNIVYTVWDFRLGM